MERIEECMSFLLGKAYQQVQQAAKQRLGAHGVTPTQYALLRVLWERDGQTGAELGERLLLDSATITGILDRLERAELIVRRSDPGDRRVNRIFATARARDLQPALDWVMDEVNAAFLKGFAPTEQRRLKEQLALLGQVGARGE
ncbi:MAG: MarR family transcriptional regulator [Thermomicrobiales bacterium]